MSVGDKSGSISEMIFWTIVFVSSSDPPSLMDVNVNREIEQSSVMPHLSLSEEDIDKIATAVKQKITVDIESIITAKTEPLRCCYFVDIFF
jgi:hypothetical protein